MPVPAPSTRLPGPGAAPTVGGVTDETTRAARLLDARAKVETLFAEIEARQLVVPGQGRP